MTLIQSGVDINSRLEEKTPLYVAVENNRKDIVKILLDQQDIDPSGLSYHHHFLETPIVCAARLQNKPMLELLLKATNLNAFSEQKVTKSALHCAAGNGDLEIASLLLKHGSDINWCGGHQHSALHFAAIEHQTDMQIFLLNEGAKISCDHETRTPLHTAAVHGDQRSVAAYMKASPEAILVPDFGKASPLYLASLRHHSGVVATLLSFAKQAGIDIKSVAGLALHPAAEGGYMDILEMLLDTGADVNAEVHNHGHGLEIPLDKAVKSGSIEIVKYLIAKGAYINKLRHMEPKMSNGYERAIFRALSKDGMMMDMERLLLFHGADQNVKTLLPKEMATIEQLMNVAIERNSAALSPGLQIIWDQLLFTTQTQIAASIVFSYEHSVIACYEDNPVLCMLKHCADSSPSPQGLLELCRNTLRAYLSDLTGSRSILDRLTGLPLPQFLMEYVTYQQFLGKEEFAIASLT